MPFSHHSHSGQFCAHARSTLEEMVQAAISRKMNVFALTEHMPREEADLYAEEIENGQTAAGLRDLFSSFHAEATRLRDKYASEIHILIGFESEWIRPLSSLSAIRTVLDNANNAIEFFVGSVHHVHGIPIDFSRSLYLDARNNAGGTDEGLFEDYFDAQFQMLTALRPMVVGHFDLIRLFSDEPDAEGGLRRWEGVWERVVRNLKEVVEYGGLIEMNTAAWRKGLKGPYPSLDICKVFLAMGGEFCLSDDSHGVDQVGTNYYRLPNFLKEVGIEQICYLRRVPEEESVNEFKLEKARVRCEELLDHLTCKS